MAKKAIIGHEYYEALKAVAEKKSAGNNFFKKALTHDTSASGVDFIPESWSADIIRQVYERAWHRQLIPTLTMTTIKMNIPRFLTRWSGKFISGSISSTDPADQIGVTSTANSTGEREIELKTLSINMMVDNKFLSYNANKQIETILREDMIAGMYESEQDALVNGDGDGTHQDSDTQSGAATLPAKAFDGLRKLSAATDVDAGNAAFGTDEVSKMIKNLGRYGQGTKDRLVLLVPPSVADQIRRTVTQLQTLEKYGPQATIFVGEIGKIFGVSVIETNAIRETLNASGVYDGSTTDRTVALMFNVDYVFWGVPAYAERALSLKKWDDPRFDRVQLILTEDIGFQARHPEAICQCINISTTANS